MIGEVVTVINRTSHPLDVKMNGRTRTLAPGPNQLTTEWIRFAKMQNPRRGTFKPGTIDGEYLVGVQGFDAPELCSMLAPDEEHLSDIEMFNRSGEAADGHVVTNVATGERPPRRLSDPVSANGGFGGVSKH